MSEIWDVLIIGGGHAGCEASLAAARMGQKSLLLTQNVDQVAAMSCNPAIGGLAKGHLVKEIDALGGEMGLAADATGIQFKKLNQKKGPAVQATRCQSDMIAYKANMRERLESQENLTLMQGEVTEIMATAGKITGVKTQLGDVVLCKTIIICAGTFLNGLIHIGDQTFEAGRAWDFCSKPLAEQLKDLGLKTGRLKTGTTPRLDGRTIDFSVLDSQPGDDIIAPFSFWETARPLKQVPCFITFTGDQGKQIVQDNLHLSAMYSGAIKGVGPRYCPSIEDKIQKFPDKERHQIFLEPTSLQSFEYYPNGMSTSLPLRVQQEFMRSIAGLEKVNIVRPGYAIEYDFVFPTQLKASLECKDIEGLFLAGQINGTSGYEEAAAQGLMAGINASLSVQGREPFVLERDQAYIGVLIDDLVSQGTNEPYRMFTSRAEYRLLLREDNADVRLSQFGYDLGLLGETKYQRFQKKQEQVAAFTEYCDKTYLVPSEKSAEVLGDLATSLLPHRFKINDFLKRPDAKISQVGKLIEKPEFHAFSSDVTEYVETLIKYEGYIIRQESQVAKYKKVDAIKIPVNFDYSKIGGLSTEVIQKLNEHKPQNLGQASRISGVTPAAITILLVAINKKEKP